MIVYLQKYFIICSIFTIGVQGYEKYNKECKCTDNVSQNDPKIKYDGFCLTGAVLL